MKRKILSLLLSFTLCLTLLPTAAFAEGPDKISITTVDELLQFAKAVDNGEYDDKTDAVVSLDADLDLTNVAWKPIGSVFAADGTLQHYFSGKFYGNGHTISNLDFSKNYGKAEYPVFGFFSVAYGAEISSLTIQGELDVSNSGYVFFGTVAGVAENSKISDCVSDVSFTDTERADINGTVAMCGYAINSTIEYCQNKGDFSVMKDTSQFWMGGIAGLAENSTVQYCANTGDMTSWTPSSGGIVGQLIQNSKVINCYSTGKMAPLGKGTTDFGGIAGAVGKGTEIRHCYFAGEVDLSQYTATKPYTRLGGIAGGVSSDTPVFENNYFVETENVPACSKYTEAGTAKSLKYMETEDFFNEITAAGGNYRFNSNGIPILPAPKYAVSFVVTPAELANVVIKVNGQEVASLVGLEAGTYAVEVSADNCEVFRSDITITADTATHTQTIAMTYRKSSGGDDSDPTYAIEVGKDIRNGTVTANRRYAERGDTVTITVKPDDGFKLDDLTVTDKNGNELKLTDKGNGKYTFTMPGSKVEVKATFMEDNSVFNFFYDVPNDAFFYEAVKWAVKSGVTNGLSDTMFGPYESCTRAQIVTFLWRAAGSPEPKATTSAMTDLNPNAYYYKAVLWAIENGITDGMTETTFAPDATCTRGQSVTFLYRALGKKVESSASFTDVKSDAFYADAINWAVANNVTNGTSNTTFSPNADCTRAEIVTFLYRALGTAPTTVNGSPEISMVPPMGFSP